jgi:hypothetical protein
LRAVKETDERDESHADLTRHCGKSAVTMNKVFIPLETPTPLDRVDVSGDLTIFFSINGPLRVVKGTEERNDSHVDLARHYGKSAVAMKKVIHRVYLT